MSKSNDTLIIKEYSATKHINDPVKTENSEVSTENLNGVLNSEKVKSSSTTDEVTDSDKTNLEFTRANIESISNYVNIVDSDQENNLDMFCYNRSQDTFLGVPYNIASSSLLKGSIGSRTGQLGSVTSSM